MRIGVVLVTYNRLDKLKITLDLFDKQTYKPSYVLVVNNASTDGTFDYLKEWTVEKKEYEKLVINSISNEGGSGGFHRGLEESLKLDAEWVWVSDDDAFPEVDALEKSIQFLEKYGNSYNISAICGQVINNGKIDCAHRSTYSVKNNRILHNYSILEDYKKEFFEINAFSYVGTIINRKKMQECGTTLSEYFIWYDDTEHSLRLSKYGKIFVVPSIRINHNVDNVVNKLSWKMYYGARNQLDMYARHFSLKQYRRYRNEKKLKITLKKLVRKFFLLDYTSQTIHLDAIKDADNKSLGINDVYKPGWKLQVKGKSKWKN